MADRLTFRQRDLDSNEFVSESGRYLIEKSYTEGPRGGRTRCWHLYAVVHERLHHIASEARLRDVWAWIENEDE